MRAKKSQGSFAPLVMLAGAFMVGIAAITCLVGVLVVYLAQKQEAKIATGVMVANVPVGGKSKPEAQSLLEQNANRPVLLTDGNRQWTVMLSDLGTLVDVPSTLDAAQKAKSNETIQPRYNIDMNITQQGLITISSQTNIPPTTDLPGRSLDIPVMLLRLRNDLTGELADDVIELSMIEVAKLPPPEEPKVTYTGPTTVHVVERGQELSLIAQMYNVAMQDIVTMNDIANPDLINVGQELVIPAAGVYVPPAPPAPLATGRSLLVSTADQRIYAYEDGVMVRSHLVSTGLPATPTVKGDYKVYVKFVADDMQGADYFLPQVPWVMYFYQGYGIHGTYWHNSFGRPMSHGCVNLPPDEAEWFFNFASVGTLVRVI